MQSNMACEQVLKIQDGSGTIDRDELAAIMHPGSTYGCSKGGAALRWMYRFSTNRVFAAML